MGARGRIIHSLADTAGLAESLCGGKAVTLGRLATAGFRVPPGFCISVAGYQWFVEEADLPATIRMELGRKPFASMRWEEIWDAALRIRTAFLNAPIPTALAGAIGEAYTRLDAPVVAIRSSAPGEDSASRSHAGLHESVVGVTDERGMLDAVRIVWASLWSDAALLYRQELGMDAQRSRMAVIVQSFEDAAPSGVGFGADPRFPDQDRQVVEAVPGYCEDLVSGLVDPDRWIMKRTSGELIEWRPGRRGESKPIPLLDRPDLEHLHKTLRTVEATFGWVPDVEWTGRANELTILQARPVTQKSKPQDERAWYLTLRPGRSQLAELCERVTEELIPALENDASRLAAEPIDALTDSELADAIEARAQLYDKWRQTYWDEFIPFAHGVRQLGHYYNDAVRPDDPYEFVGILRRQQMIASDRNAALETLASVLRENPELRQSLGQMIGMPAARERVFWRNMAADDVESPSTADFYRELDAFLDRYMNIVYDDVSLDERPDFIVRNIIELSRSETRPQTQQASHPRNLERRLLDAVGPDRRQEALDVIRVGRLSWKLRDDDNVLMGRLENQLRRALDLGAARLRSQGRLATGTRVAKSAADSIARALRSPDSGVIDLPREHEPDARPMRPSEGTSPRQLIGQPAAPGLATGSARIVKHVQDIGEFKQGEILVCDAIQPTMTHLVPIAAGIVERRGGMLIHGAIIARELGVPCVNGVIDAAEILADGDLLTVDGYLGIVTVGPPEFDLEMA